MEENNYNIGFLYKGPNDCVKLFYIIVIKQHDRSGDEAMAKALKETVNWYANCLRKVNPVVEGKTDGYMLLKDYNQSTPGLQILHLPKLERFILSFKRGITSFSDDKAMFHFCQEVLGYKEEQLAMNGEFTVIKM